VADNLAAVALGDDVFQFHTPPHYATRLDIRCPCEKNLWERRGVKTP
jgi:hypothetical protein